MNKTINEFKGIISDFCQFKNCKMNYPSSYCFKPGTKLAHNPKAFMLIKLIESELKESIIFLNTIIILLKSGTIFAINLRNFDYKNFSTKFFNEVNFMKGFNNDILLHALNSFERVIEINLFRSNTNIIAESISLNKSRGTLFIVFLKKSENNSQELFCCEVKMGDIIQKLDMLEKIIEIIYSNGNSTSLTQKSSNNFSVKNKNFHFRNLNQNTNFNKQINIFDVKCSLNTMEYSSTTENDNNDLKVDKEIFFQKNILLNYLHSIGFLDVLTDCKNYINNNFSLDNHFFTLHSLLEYSLSKNILLNEIFEIFYDIDINKLLNFNDQDRYNNSCFIRQSNRHLTRCDENCENINYRNNNFRSRRLIFEEGKENFYMEKIFQILKLFTFNFEIIFANESFTPPSFIELDELNNVTITKDSTNTFKVWRTDNYKFIFQLNDIRIEEIRTAFSVLFSIFIKRENEKIFLQVGMYELINGKFLLDFIFDITSEENLEILDFFHDKMLIKQLYRTPKLIDLKKFEEVNLDNGYSQYFNHDSVFVFFQEPKIFLALNKNTLAFFTLSGNFIKKVTNDNVQFLNIRNIFISQNKRFLVIYWDKRFDEGKQKFRIVKANLISGQKDNFKTNSYKNSNQIVTSDSISILTTFNNNNSYLSSKSSINNCNNITSKARRKIEVHPCLHENYLNEGVLDITFKSGKSPNSKIQSCDDFYKLNGKHGSKSIINNGSIIYNKGSYSCLNDYDCDYSIKYNLKNKNNVNHIENSNNKTSSAFLTSSLKREFFNNNYGEYFSNFQNQFNCSEMRSNDNPDVILSNFKFPHKDILGLDFSNESMELKKKRNNNLLESGHKINFDFDKNIFSTIFEEKFKSDKKENKLKIRFQGEIQIISIQENFIDEKYRNITEDEMNCLENVKCFITENQEKNEINIEITNMIFEENSHILYAFTKKGEIIKIMV